MGQELVVKGHSQGSLVSVRCQMARVTGQSQWSLVSCQGSLVRVMGHWSKITGQTTFYHQTVYESARN